MASSGPNLPDTFNSSDDGAATVTTSGHEDGRATAREVGGDLRTVLGQVKKDFEGRSINPFGKNLCGLGPSKKSVVKLCHPTQSSSDFEPRMVLFEAKRVVCFNAAPRLAGDAAVSIESVYLRKLERAKYGKAVLFEIRTTVGGPVDYELATPLRTSMFTEANPYSLKYSEQSSVISVSPLNPGDDLPITIFLLFLGPSEQERNTAMFQVYHRLHTSYLAFLGGHPQQLNLEMKKDIRKECRAKQLAARRMTFLEECKKRTDLPPEEPVNILYQSGEENVSSDTDPNSTVSRRSTGAVRDNANSVDDGAFSPPSSEDRIHVEEIPGCSSSMPKPKTFLRAFQILDSYLLLQEKKEKTKNESGRGPPDTRSRSLETKSSLRKKSF